MRGLPWLLVCVAVVAASGCGDSKPNPFASGPLVDTTTPTKDLGPVGKPLSDDPLVMHLPAVGEPRVISQRGPYGLARAPIVLIDHQQRQDELLIYWRTRRRLPRRHAYAFTSVDGVDGLMGESEEAPPPGYSTLASPSCYFTEGFESLGYRAGQRRRFTLTVRRGSLPSSRMLSRTVVTVKLHDIRSDEQGRDIDSSDDRRWRQMGCHPFS